MDRPRAHTSTAAEPGSSPLTATGAASLAVLLFAILVTLASFVFVIAAIAHG
jgi:hypothetical protein